MNALPNAVAVPLLLSFFVPLLVSAVVQSRWPSWLKTLLAAAVSVAVALITLAIQGQLGHIGLDNLFGLLVLVVVTTGGSYARFWRGTGIAGWLEKATNLGGDRTVDAKPVSVQDRVYAGQGAIVDAPMPAPVTPTPSPRHLAQPDGGTATVDPTTAAD